MNTYKSTEMNEYFQNRLSYLKKLHKELISRKNMKNEICEWDL